MIAEFERIVARAADLDEQLLLSHGVGAAVAAWMLSRDRLPSQDMQRQAWSAGFAEMTALLMLDRIAPYIDEPVAVIKGPEVAACYPSPGQRTFADLDVLAVDGVALHRRLLDAGFQQPGVDAAPRHHHLPALISPGLDAVVEIHVAVGTYPWLTPPSASALIGRSQPSRCHDAFRRLDDADHAVLLEAHAASKGTTPSLRDALDIAAVLSDWDAVELAARRWGAGRLARVSRGLVEALASDQSRSPYGRLAARLRSQPPAPPGFAARSAAIAVVAGPTGLARHLIESGRRLEEVTRPTSSGGGSARRDRIATWRRRARFRT